ncbi:MAG TPA: M42 family metallopeptidase [Bacillota bacterium]|nr:M42 family metallopeptidase [Bacillota bacterium]HPQ61315.1 M42 family metallopeptidase [Bacillota bacterium]HRX91438.1 M42 family metallopeptidase [Candidatus Izemoplasmatales bacterium]
MKETLDYIFDLAKKILSIPSPSGYCREVIDFVSNEADKMGFKVERTVKGNALIKVKGTENLTLGLSAHVDTLGAMVKSITSDGYLRFTTIGGPIWPTLDGEYVMIRTRTGKKYDGTFLSTSPSVHVYKDAMSKERTPDSMMVRIDETVHSKDDVIKLGIAPGDFIFIDPKTTITDSGYIKSRFLDDKISVAILYGLLKEISENRVKPKMNLEIIISTYEEVGHGAASLPHVDELIAVDMGCVGDDLSCTEEMVSICCKDSTGPYDYDVVTRLVESAKVIKADYATDIYPFYGSDVSSALRAGHDVKGGLIGPGVHASHGMERTHRKGIENTLKLLISYIS